jgi:hypothetical protein
MFSKISSLEKLRRTNNEALHSKLPIGRASTATIVSDMEKVLLCKHVKHKCILENDVKINALLSKCCKTFINHPCLSD